MLTQRAEEVLQIVHHYRYLTAQDLAYRLFSPKSLTYARELLCQLCGEADFQPHQYLYRFPLPLTTTGEKTRIFTLGRLGREILIQNLGIPVDWYFRPQQTQHLSYGFLIHALILTRFLIAAHHFTQHHPEFKLIRFLTAYELEKANRRDKDMVIPDAWLLFQSRQHNIPVLLEIDRGTEHKRHFQQHVAARIHWVESGTYAHIFQEEAIVIAYATTGQLPEYRDSRRKVMVRWTRELLQALHKEAWAPVFYFTSIDWANLYQTPLFDQPVWYQPGQTQPVPLLS